jgi:dihydrofolate reductase
VERAVSSIVALDLDYVIGVGGQMPWHLPADLREFRRRTMGAAIIMGRRTWESIGRVLPGRLNVVVTSRPLEVEGVEVVASLEAAYALAEARGVAPIVIGGARLYEAAMERVGRLYVTAIAHRFGVGDVYFPALEPMGWRVVERVVVDDDATFGYGYAFCTLERRGQAPALRVSATRADASWLLDAPVEAAGESEG